MEKTVSLYLFDAVFYLINNIFEHLKASHLMKVEESGDQMKKKIGNNLVKRKKCIISLKSINSISSETVNRISQNVTVSSRFFTMRRFFAMTTHAPSAIHFFRSLSYAISYENARDYSQFIGATQPSSCAILQLSVVWDAWCGLFLDFGNSALNVTLISCYIRSFGSTEYIKI